jgi:hypothetical protein
MIEQLAQKIDSKHQNAMSRSVKKRNLYRHARWRCNALRDKEWIARLGMDRLEHSERIASEIKLCNQRGLDWF